MKPADVQHGNEMIAAKCPVLMKSVDTLLHQEERKDKGETVYCALVIITSWHEVPLKGHKISTLENQF